MTNPYIDLLGVNTHIDFAYKGSPYLDRKNVIECLKYLGVRHVRDGAGKPDSVDMWVDVRNAMPAGPQKFLFCAYIPNGAPDFLQRTFTFWPKIYANGLVSVFEAPNECDKPQYDNTGITIPWAAGFTRHVLSPYVHALGTKKLINMSVGAGWTKDDGYQGNYDAIPDMRDCCDYANPHTYPNLGEPVLKALARLNTLALKSMLGKPVIVTELGWDLREGHNMDQIAADIVTAVKSGLAERIYIYALFDDQSGRFGLFDNDGTPRAGAKAIRQLLGGTV